MKSVTAALVEFWYELFFRLFFNRYVGKPAEAKKSIVGFFEISLRTSSLAFFGGHWVVKKMLGKKLELWELAVNYGKLFLGFYFWDDLGGKFFKV